MRKDLWIGAVAATLVHGTAVWYSLFQVVKPHIPASVEQVVLTTFTPPPPAEIEPPDPTDASEPHVKVEAPPSLPDVPSLQIITPFTEPIHPTPPNDPTQPPQIILPKGPVDTQRDAIRIFDPSELNQPPVPTTRPSPNYPFELRRKGIEGKAVVDFVVDERGNVLRPYALEGDMAEFGQAAVEGVKRWHFRPGVKDGQPVRVHMQIPLVFSLNQGD